MKRNDTAYHIGALSGEGRDWGLPLAASKSVAIALYPSQEMPDTCCGTTCSVTSQYFSANTKYD